MTKELYNGMPAKEFRETINNNFETIEREIRNLEKLCLEIQKNNSNRISKINEAISENHKIILMLNDNLQLLNSIINILNENKQEPTLFQRIKAFFRVKAK